MTNFEKQVLETIKKYNLIEKGDSIVIGVSGRTGIQYAY